MDDAIETMIMLLAATGSVVEGTESSLAEAGFGEGSFTSIIATSHDKLKVHSCTATAEYDKFHVKVALTTLVDDDDGLTRICLDFMSTDMSLLEQLKEVVEEKIMEVAAQSGQIYSSEIVSGYYHAEIKVRLRG